MENKMLLQNKTFPFEEVGASCRLRYSSVGDNAMRRELIPPTRILWRSESTQNVDALVDSPERQAYVGNGTTQCRIAPGGGLLLDYGIELHGGIRIVCGRSDHGLNPVRIRFGESVGEAMGHPDNDHMVHDARLELPSHGMISYGCTGFRFLRLDLSPEARGDLILYGVFAEAVYRDLPYVGSFRCSDDRLTRIWRTGAYTVHLNMQDYIYDGIKRDRLVWMGDLNTELRVIAAVFDDLGAVRASLDFIREHFPADLPINDISSYSAWWVISQYDYYLYRGDLAYLKEQHDYLCTLIRQLVRYVAEDGREICGDIRFLDWPSTTDERAVHAGLQGILAWAFTAGEALFRTLNDHDGVSLCISQRARLGCHRANPGTSKQAAAMLALSGLEDPIGINAGILAADPYSGISTFMGYYVLEARAMADDRAGALEVIRRYWGGMLDAGATTFWEDFDLSWLDGSSRIDELPRPGQKDIHADFGRFCYRGLRHSLCHGWAGGPTAWLSRHLLGVEFLEPGGKSVRVSPRLFDLDWLEGVFPTAFGSIEITAEKRSDGTIFSDIRLPDGVFMPAAAPYIKRF